MMHSGLQIITTITKLKYNNTWKIDDYCTCSNGMLLKSLPCTVENLIFPALVFSWAAILIAASNCYASITH